MAEIDNLRLDVAVVGGGVGGAYSAWRLLNAQTRRDSDLSAMMRTTERTTLRVGLFEGSDRIGGRLYSLTPPGMSHLRAEVGGMRFLTTQRHVANLVDHLGLTHRPFSQVTNRQYLRGHYLTEKDWRDPARVPYHLAEDERGKTPGELFLHVLERICPDGLRATPEAWKKLRHTGSFEGIPLADLGFWNAVMRVVSVEAYHMLLEAYGHETTFGNWNAADVLALTLGHRSTQPQLRTLDRGMEALPTELVRQFEKDGGVVYMRHKLWDIVPDAVNDTPCQAHIQLHFATPTGPRIIYARHVILAMPRRALTLLSPHLFLLEDTQFLDDLRSVIPLHASKLFLAYKEPWWEPLGITEGASDTDLPVRQCYYFGTEGKMAGADPSNLRSLLLATYNDGRSVDFWSGYVGRPMVGTNAGPLPTLHPVEASDALIGEAQRQIRLMHGPDATVPDPYWSAFMDWSHNPYGGGWHVWLVNARSDEVMRRMRQPRLDVNVYIVGEAYSAEQGWIEGALTTSEVVLQDKLGLDAPAYLSSQGVAV